MDNPQRPPTPPDRDNDHEPVARWENEGGAYDERDAQAPPRPCDHTAHESADPHNARPDRIVFAPCPVMIVPERAAEVHTAA